MTNHAQKLLERLRKGASSSYLWVLFLWAGTLLARLIRNGEVYGLNYNLWQPDGALYHVFTLHLLGKSWEDAIIKVNAFFLDRVQITYLEPVMLDYIQDLLYSRPLYSILSLPFVLLFGQFGMLMVPAISFLLIGIILVKISSDNNCAFFGVILFGILTISTSTTRWVFSNLTDGLLMMLVALCYLLLDKEKSNKILLMIVISFALLTRPSGPIIIALLLPFIYKRKQYWLGLGVALATIGTLILAAYSPESAGVQTSGPYTVFMRIRDFATHLIKVIIFEFGQIFVLDRVLFVYLVFIIGFAFWQIRNVWSQSFLLVSITTFLMGAWNGAIGVNFRYQLPLLIASNVMLIKNAYVLENLLNKSLDTRNRNKEKKAPPKILL